MYFRPFPILTLFAVPILVALVALGMWQAQRAEWKAELVQTFAETAEAPPLTAEAACAAGLSEGQVITPPVGQGRGLRMFGHEAGGAAGWRVFQTADLCGRTVLVESGFEKLMIGGPGGLLPPGAIPERLIDRFVVEPWPERPAMAADNSAERNEWHWFDTTAIADAVGAPDLNAGFIVTPYAGVPAFLSRTPPETHIGYAVTWFGMAVAFLVIYAVFHARAGRLRFGRTKA
jgi:surfeit locus 1 family protein